MDNILERYELGLPCVLLGSPGRIVAAGEEWGEINGIDYPVSVTFATPSGISVETGFFHLQEITGEQLERLLEMEQIVKAHGDKPYNGLWEI
jgi:hypothetical protein